MNKRMNVRVQRPSIVVLLVVFSKLDDFHTTFYDTTAIRSSVGNERNNGLARLRLLRQVLSEARAPCEQPVTRFALRRIDMDR